MAARLLKLLLVISMAVQALLQAGIMPAPAHKDGGLAVVLCTANGTHTITLDRDGAELPAEPEQRDGKLCDYATIGAIAFLDRPHRVEAEVRHAAVVYRIARNRFHRTLKLGAVSARGPPAGMMLGA